MKRVKAIFCAFGVLLLFVAMYLFFDTTCIVRFFTGVSCPGCGMTRAFISVLTLNFGKSFYYHPLWPLVPLTLISFFLLKKHKRARIAVITAVTVAFILVYVIRWFIGPQEVVYADFTKSIIWRIFK